MFGRGGDVIACPLALDHLKTEGSFVSYGEAIRPTEFALYFDTLRCTAPWPVYVRLESLIERWGSRQLCLSRKLYGKIDVFAEELPRKSSPGQKFTTRKRGNRRITARNT